MKIISIIPARSGSKGIKNKNIVKINSKPLIYFTIKQSLKTKLIQRTIVSTDSKKLPKYHVNMVQRFLFLDLNQFLMIQQKTILFFLI